MKILFYVLPVVERQEPWHKTSWVEKVQTYANILSQDCQTKYEFTCVVGDTLYDYAKSKLKNCNLVVIPHNAIIPALARNALEYTTKVHQNNDQKFMEQVANLHQSFLGNEHYDICISFTSVPFIKKIYPEIATIHTETAVFRKAPFPHTVYLDPAGMYDQASLAKLEHIVDYKPTEAEEKIIKEIQKSQLPAALPTPKQVNLLANITKNYKKTVLLAMDLPNHYPFNSCSPFDDQFDLILNALNSIPEDYLLIVAPHPKLSMLNRETVAYFKQNYNNFYWGPWISNKISSYTFISSADAVVATTSTVGLHSILWEKPLIVLGKSQLKNFAQGYSLENIKKIIDTPLPTQRLNIFSWLLTRYAIPLELLYTTDVLSNALKRAKKFCSGSNLDLENYYAEPFYDIEELSEYYQNYLIKFERKKFMENLNYIKKLKDYIRFKKINTV